MNEISKRNLKKVGLLIRLGLATTEPTPTGELLADAELAGDPKAGLGALKMAEVLGLLHATRGERKALLWRSGPPKRWHERDPKLPNLLPFRRLRDLLQYYRGSLIGTPDLVRDAEITNRHEALGALEALHVLEYVEIGKLDPQTVAWRWIAGRGECRVYQRGYFARAEAPVGLYDGPVGQDGKVRWAWIDELVHAEWLVQDQADGVGTIATDGLPRYRAPSAEDSILRRLLADSLEAMPRLQRAVIVLTLLRGLTQREAAAQLSVSEATANRLAERGLASVRSVLRDAGFAPSATNPSVACSTDLTIAA